MSERKELIVTGMCAKMLLVAAGLMLSTITCKKPDCSVRIATHLRRFAQSYFPSGDEGQMFID